MDQPLVDVIITTYRRPIEIIKRALDSVLNQTYKKIEIAIVNDYPEDKLMAESIRSFIDEYKDPKIHYYSYEKNKGACYARNFGAKHLNGEFIAFLDDDDEWLPEKIEKQLLGFVSSEVGFVYSPFYGYGIRKDGTVITRGNCEGVITQDLLEGNKLGGCSMVMMRRKVFEEVDGFDESLKSLQDYDLWIRICQNYDVGVVKEPCINYYNNLNTNQVSKNTNNYIDASFYISKKYSNIVNKKLLMQMTLKQ